MLRTLIVLGLLVPAIAYGQDRATLDTRQLLAETVTTAKPRAEFLNGTRDSLPAFVRVLAKYKQLTAAPVVVKDPAGLPSPAPAKKAVGMNLSGLSWYASRQTFTNLLQGGYWAINWAQVPSDKLDALGYPKDWSQSYVRLLGAPTGGWVNQTSIACSWKGSGTLTHSGSINQVKGDHTLTFDMPSWGGAVKNTWFSLYGVSAADPFREFECHDAKNASGNEFSEEVIASSSKYAVLRFMDWNETNSSPARTAANRPDPRTLDNPGQALENQMRLAKLADADPWFNHSWNDDATYMQWAAKQAHDTLPAGHKIYVELSNEVWNFQFWQAQDNLTQATTLKINPNNGYGAWQNYSRRAIDMFKIWEAAFADRPKDLVRVLGTQSAYPEVTRQEMSYPGIADHVDAIAGAPYFSHDRQVPYSDALLQASVTDAVATLKTTCDIARASAPNIRCITYEGGQHELPTALLSQDQFETLERSQFMGDMYSQYLKAISAQADLVMLFNDVGPISKYGAWGAQEYGGQVGAPKQVAVERFLQQ
ncbi:hypothetical protein [Sphingomonas sp. TREG-RG-20F-R18-01]|uniref:hypothetical protein n=1 Tax=Sphingomonas sp. TREG-RG-20F-R18-01 TaxID=2914982 RepID=UPI001F582CEC|nr:hypothetical protein [Sphingomonas sp. TREG-RG-20F-R18-01]